MTDLAVPADVQSLLGIGAVDTTLIQAKLDGLDELLSELTGQLYLKATSQSPVVKEACNGAGRAWTWVARPIASLTAVYIGQDPNAPDETLTVSPATTVVVDPRKKRRVVRVDGAIFPAGIANVYISYSPADNIPASASMAIVEACAFLYRRRGSEDAESESAGGFAHKLLTDLNKCPAWALYVGRNKKPSIGIAGGSGGPVIPGSLWPYGIGAPGAGGGGLW